MTMMIIMMMIIIIIIIINILRNAGIMQV